MITLAGEFLNAVLSELCQTYDLVQALGTTQILLNPSQGGDFNLDFSSDFSLGTFILPGSGPYPLPTDYLRMACNEAIYMVYGVPYVMVNIDLAEFDQLVQQAGINNYPQQFATNPADALLDGNASMYVWPPSGGSYLTQLRYWRQMPDIPTPESSSAIPWFPNDNYLLTRVAGEMMKVADDARWEKFLGEGPSGAQGILNRYLKLQSDDEGRAMTVKLDRRRFGQNFSRLPNTKTLGW